MPDLTVVFDLDGTLVDTAPDLIAATNHALADLGLGPLQGDALRPFIGFGARHMIVEGLRQSGTTLADFEIESLLARFLDYYEDNIAVESRPYPEAVAVLERLRRQGARLAICTNKREALSRKLIGALELDHYFAALAGRDTFPVFKPHPEHLRGVIRLAAGDPARAVMIGDTKIDVETARAAGVPVIACAFGYSDTPVRLLEPDTVIGHFREFEAAIAGIAPGLKAVGPASADR